MVKLMSSTALVIATAMMTVTMMTVRMTIIAIMLLMAAMMIAMMSMMMVAAMLRIVMARMAAILVMMTMTMVMNCRSVRQLGHDSVPHARILNTAVFVKDSNSIAPARRGHCAAMVAVPSSEVASHMCMHM